MKLTSRFQVNSKNGKFTKEIVALIRSLQDQFGDTWEDVMVNRLHMVGGNFFTVCPPIDGVQVFTWCMDDVKCNQLDEGTIHLIY